MLLSKKCRATDEFVFEVNIDRQGVDALQPKVSGQNAHHVSV